MSDDAQLLRDYCQGTSERAFDELVQRYVGLVHSTALRLVHGDASLAEDVTQEVFIDLARKASSLLGRTSLIGWLYTATRYAAAKAVRSEQRRRNREQETQPMQNSSSSETDWDRLQPHLEDAMHELAESDREAVLLRYFQKQPFKRVAETLRTSEAAARMRVDRAVDKLRIILDRKGVHLTGAALSGVIAGQAVSAAPVSLVATCAAAKGITATASTLGGLKLAFGIAAAIGVTATATFVATIKERSSLQDRIAALQGQLVEAKERQEKLAIENTALEATAMVRETQLAGLVRDTQEIHRLRGLVGEMRWKLDALAGRMNEKESIARLLAEAEDLAMATNETDQATNFEAVEQKQRLKREMLLRMGRLYHSLMANQAERFPELLSHLESRLKDLAPAVDPELLPSNFQIVFTNSPVEVPMEDTRRTLLLLEREPSFRPEATVFVTNYFGRGPSYRVRTNHYVPVWQRLFLMLDAGGAPSFDSPSREIAASDEELFNYVQALTRNTGFR